ncbi:MAG: ABC transporter substrate-binding protein [Candidatus Rokubacteria bacterium]|nr:ABC transporter substrate-binding protein [Candidatus Rokubacteria bacterium]
MGKALAAWLMVAGAAVASPVTGPREAVESAIVRVLSVIEDGEVNGKAVTDRRAEVRRIARELFDYDEITRRTLSRHWSQRTADEQAEFVALFSDLLERSYVSRIEAYAGEKIAFVGEVIDGGFATVRSKVVTQRRTETVLDYRMHVREGRWRVYDVLIDGVSFVSTYRSQFDRVIQAESYGALVERLRKRNFESAVAERKKL